MGVCFFTMIRQVVAGLFCLGHISFAIECPPELGWIPLNQTCYFLSPTKMDWWQAQVFCEDKGGWLAEIKSPDQQSKLNSVLTIEVSYWIGLNDLASKGQWDWQHSNVTLGPWTNWA